MYIILLINMIYLKIKFIILQFYLLSKKYKTYNKNLKKGEQR